MKTTSRNTSHVALQDNLDIKGVRGAKQLAAVKLVLSIMDWSKWEAKSLFSWSIFFR